MTAVGNVVCGRELGFVVTSKVQEERTSQWRFVKPQLIAIVILVVAAVIGIARQLLGSSPSDLGTVVNLAWVGYDLVVLSVIIQAARFTGHPRAQEAILD